MHRLLTLAASAVLGFAPVAFAADLPLKAPGGPVAAPYNWTGFYLGGNAGYGWGGSTGNTIVVLSDPTGLFTGYTGFRYPNLSPNGAIGGGQIGYNWQFNSFVLGIEGDIDGILNKSRGNNVIVVPTVGPVAVAGHGGGNWVSTLAARFGWAVDRTLFYGKVGYGWANGSGSATVTNLTTGQFYGIGGDGTRSGWLVGGGIEYAFAPNWTVKGEYNYLNTGKSRTFFVPATGPFLAGDVFHSGGRDVQMVKFGFNYLFR